VQPRRTRRDGPNPIKEDRSMSTIEQSIELDVPVETA
jgi:hypothetical protein